MGSLPADAKLPWVRTPCVLSPEISRIAGCNVYLKLDNLQPSGSFKSRGIGNLMTRAAAASPSTPHFYCSSGGNAGLACATAALSLGCPATIVLPNSSPALMKNKLLALGVEVQIHGSMWSEADRYVREELMPNDKNGVYVPPFDHQQIWDGASSIVTELREQIEGPIHGIVCSVGGGGLVNGIMQGIESLSWSGPKPHVLAVETIGADALNASVRAGEHVSIPEITSIAKSLGAARVSAQTWRWAERGLAGEVSMKSIVVSDADAAMSAVRFADDARLLVEVSCGATLAVAYKGDLREHFGQGCSDDEWKARNIVLEVCGGAGVTMELLRGYAEAYGKEASVKLA